MITNITTNQSYQYITVQNNASSVYINSGAQTPGMMRMNISTNQYEVYDGLSWRQVSGTATVDLTQHTINILRWAESKMQEDQRVKKLIQDNPTVADAYRAYQDAADKLKVVVALTDQK